MANFRPFKRYILYCLDRLVEAHQAQGPFLDVGCGIGDVSLHLAETRGWPGKAIDVSDIAIARARELLAAQTGMVIARHSLEDEQGIYNTVVMLDVLEHIEDDERALHAVAARLAPGGHAFFSVPSNPAEWRWDDDLYGHVRRYRVSDLMSKLRKAQLEPVVAIDISYPVFWLMRRAYTRLLRKRRPSSASAWERTLASTDVNAWQVPVIGPLLSRGDRLWQIAYRLQYRYFRHRIDDGHEVLVAARKCESARPHR